jgi:hypothetical protein
MLTSTKTRTNEQESEKFNVPLNFEITLFAHPDAKIVLESNVENPNARTVSGFNAEALLRRYLVQSL